LFDPQWYLSENPEVAAHRLDPVLHYLESGWKEGRNPHALFNIRYYLASNPQVARAGVEPLSHFLQAGARDARSPSASFDMLYYQAEHPDVVTSGMNPLVHYVTRGAALKYRPHPLFDSDSWDGTTDLTNADHALAANDRIKDPTATCEPDLMENLDPGRGVCIVTPDFIGPVKNGGIGTACYHYARTLVAAGYPVTVLFTGLLSGSQSTHWRRHYAKQRITFLWVGDLPPIPHVIYGGSWFLERSQQILIFLAQQHFSFIHFQDWQANGFWAIRAKQLGYALRDSILTVMMHSSTRWIDQGMQQYPKDATAQVRLDFCETYCMRHCDILLSPSQHMFDWAAANSIELAEDRMLVPYLQSNPIEQPVMLPPDAGHVIFFGRLETRKGLHIFADALRLLKKQPGDVPVRVSLLGKHSTVNSVSSEEVIADLQKEIPETKFTVIDNFDSFEALNYIKRSRGLVVVASLLDNYPYAVLECIEHHLPFIAAAVGGIPEMVDERVLFSPSPDQLATVLGSRRSLNHATLRHKYVPEVARDRWLTLHDRTNLPLQQPETREEKVSVCVAYYNHGRYLENLIQAFQAQDYADFEVIVVNDGSTGYSASEFDRVTHNCTDERFQFISTENHGPGAARNLAVSLSTGSYLIFFDSDNLPKDNSLISRLVKAVNVSRADCITVPYDMVDENCAAPSDTNVIGIYRPLGSCVVLGFSENVFGDTTMIIRKSVFGQLGGFSTDRECAEDHEFLLRLAIRGFRLEVYPESLLYYRVSRLSRYRSSNRYKIFESLMAQLAEAPPSTLLNIVERVALPLVLASRQ
jgi:glycosyltransferase involved in cell wall biosynthesis